MLFLSVLPAVYQAIVASLWLAACCLWLESHQKISDKISYMHPAADHGPPGTMAAGRCV
tara:strand:+ start:387 stop:563 length:177 start_codon:yes stop_codon:yes gene_type:complete